jgi:hypothetical protein
LGEEDVDRIRIETTLSKGAVAIDESTDVSCVVYFDDEVIEVPTVVTATPMEGLAISDWTVTGSIDAEYDITCGVRNTNFIDGSPARLIVGKGDSVPARVVTELAASEVVAGTSVGVTCRVENEDGAVIEGLDTLIEVPNGVGLDGTSVVAQQAGEHEIYCRLVENDALVSHTPGLLNVLPGPADTVTALVEPAKAVYKPGDIVTVNWVAKDAYGNEVLDSEGTVSAPAVGVDSVGDAAWELTEDGERTFTVTLTSNGASDDVTIMVDGTGPLVVITSPERGQMITEPELLTVTGIVTDAFGLASVKVNDVPVSVDEDGQFSTQIESVYGLNPVFVEAFDTNENRGVGSVAWYYASAYQPADSEDTDAARLDNALQIWLGQDVLDDFDHSEPEVDDLAHLLELLLTYADFADLLGKPVLFEQKFPGVVSETFGDSNNPVELNGDLTLWIDISSVTAGTAGLNLLSRDGGLDVSAAFGPVMENGEMLQKGLVVQLSVNMKFELAATTSIGSLPVSVDLSPPPTAISTASIEFGVLDLDTSFDIQMTDGVLDINGQQIAVVPSDIVLSPLANVGIDLGSVSFSIAGFELASIPLGTVDLTQLVSGIDGLFQGLLNPILNAIVPLLTDFLQPLIAVAGGDLLESALKSLEIEQAIELPEVLGQSLGEVTLSAALGDIEFDASGVAVGLDAAAVSAKGVELTPPGSIRRDGCLDPLAPQYELPSAGPMELALGFDLINQLLYSLWYGGGINVDLGAADISDLSGDFPIDGGTVTLQPLMPPILSDCNGKSQLVIQLGDALIDADLQALGLDLTFKAWIAAEIGVSITAESDQLSFVVNGVSLFQLELFDVEGAFDGNDAGLETLLQALISDVLLDQVAGQALASFPIPSIDLSGLAPEVPDGSVIKLSGLTIKRVDGYFQVDGTLGPLAPGMLPE